MLKSVTHTPRATALSVPGSNHVSKEAIPDPAPAMAVPAPGGSAALRYALTRPPQCCP